MPNPRTPTYDDLSALCAQLAAALKDMRAGWKYIRDNHGDLYGVGWDRAETAADAALTAYRTLSPQWRRVPEVEELARALYATNVPAGQRNTNWEALTDATKAAYRRHGAQMYAAINRARGEG